MNYSSIHKKELCEFSSSIRDKSLDFSSINKKKVKLLLLLNL
jgi:hypothetical protein